MIVLFSSLGISVQFITLALVAQDLLGLRQASVSPYPGSIPIEHNSTIDPSHD